MNTTNDMSLYLDPFYSEAQGVGGAHALPPLHVARLGDPALRMLLGGRPLTVHLHHLAVQVFSLLGPLPRTDQLLLQVRPETAGGMRPQVKEVHVYTLLAKCSLHLSKY